MAHALDPIAKDLIRFQFLSTRNIRGTARLCKVARNTVRDLVRAEGLHLAPAVVEKSPSIPPNVQSNQQAVGEPSERKWLKANEVQTLASADEGVFSPLKFLLGHSADHGENRAVKAHILKVRSAIIADLGIQLGGADEFKLDLAMSEWFHYRLAFLRSLKASNENYIGPLSRQPEKLAKAMQAWAVVSQKSLANHLRLMGELEIKYGKRVPEKMRGDTYIANSDVHIGAFS